MRLVASLLLLLLTSAASLAAAPPVLRLEELNRAAPHDLAKHHGHVTVLAFWGQHCPPCLVEMLGLPMLAEANPTMRIVTVATGDIRAARRWLSSRLNVQMAQNVSMTQLPGDISGTLRRLGNHAAALPFTLALAPDGSICATLLRPMDAAALEQISKACSPEKMG